MQTKKEFTKVLQELFEELLEEDNLEAALADYSICIDQGYELTQSYYQRAQIYAAMGDEENQASDLENSLKLVD